jgi:hypothetical protein
MRLGARGVKAISLALQEVCLSRGTRVGVLGEGCLPRDSCQGSEPGIASVAPVVPWCRHASSAPPGSESSRVRASARIPRARHRRGPRARVAHPYAVLGRNRRGGLTRRGRRGSQAVRVGPHSPATGPSAQGHAIRVVVQDRQGKAFEGRSSLLRGERPFCVSPCRPIGRRRHSSTGRQRRPIPSPWIPRDCARITSLSSSVQTARFCSGQGSVSAAWSRASVTGSFVSCGSARLWWLHGRRNGSSAVSR